MFPGLKYGSSLGSVCGSTSISALPPSSNILPDHVDFLREESLLGPCDHEHVASRRDTIVLDEVDGLGVVALLLESVVHGAITCPPIVVDGLFAVAGDEADGLDLVSGDFEDGAGHVGSPRQVPPGLG